MRSSILLLLLFLVSCGTTTVKKPVPAPVDVTPVVTEPTEPVKQVPFLEVTEYSGYNKGSVEKLKKAVAKVNETIASQCFEDFMIDRAIKKPGRKYTLHTTGGRTAKEVVDHLRSNTAKIRLQYYWSRKKVIGYTYPNTDKIWTNWRYYAGATVCNRGSNLGHEGSHKAPFKYGHTFKATYSRPWSVPYSINAAFKACCKND